MPGPAPKHPATRRRKNRASTAAQLPTAVPDAAPPELPDAREWHPQTVGWWQDVFVSPMASEFLDADVHGLVRLAVLVEDYWRADTPTARRNLLAEIRLQSQCFGLTPIDRRRLQWEVERGEHAKRKRQGKKGGADPRLRLAK